MKLAIIVAMTEERVIGKDNQLPWHLSADLKRFKSLTMGHTLVMGRKTFTSIGRPLPGRKNVVLTRDANFKAEGVEVVGSFEAALALCERLSGKEREPFVIGGAEVFKRALPLADTLHITWIHKAFAGDTYFPEFDLEKNFDIVALEKHPAGDDAPFSYSFVTAKRKSLA